MCLGFHSLPPLPALSDRARSYNATLNEWKLLRARGREAARTVEFGWRLGGSNGEQLTTAERVKAEFAGVVFVGDSQVREASWAALGLLLRGRELRYFERDPVFAEWRSWIRSGPKRAINGSVVRSACMPEQIRLGFSVSCGAPHGGGCRIHSPFGSAKEMGNAYKVLEAGDPVRGPGLFELACESDFFVTYQAVWGSAPINLDGLPACLRKRRLGWASAPAALPAPRRLEAQPPQSAARLARWSTAAGFTRCGAAATTCGACPMCAAPPSQREEGPPRLRAGPRLGQVTIAGLPAALLARDVVWQTVGAGFAPPFHKRSDSCALDKPPAVAAASRRWLDSRGVRHVDYTSLAEVFAPLMSDSKHFTHYTERCDKLFPELPRLVAQLELQALMGLPAALCPGGVLPPRRRLANSSAGSVSLEHPKGCMLRQGGSCSYYGVKPSLGGRVAAGRAGRTARRSTQRGAV